MRTAYGLLHGRLPKGKSPLFVVDSFSFVRYSGATSSAPEVTTSETPATELTEDESPADF